MTSNRYSFLRYLELIYCIVRTKIICKKARIIRFPLDIRGRKFIDLGNSLTTGYRCRLEAFSKNETVVMRFGNNVQINDNVHITAMKNVTIGNNVLMASNIYISDCSHGFYSGDSRDSHPDIPPIKREYDVKDVIIEDNVWIGEGCSILPGVKIEKGAIIGANSVVTKTVPAYSIAVGSPAKIIKKFNFEISRWERI